MFLKKLLYLISSCLNFLKIYQQIHLIIGSKSNKITVSQIWEKNQLTKNSRTELTDGTRQGSREAAPRRVNGRPAWRRAAVARGGVRRGGRVARPRVTACGTGAPWLAGSASAVGARRRGSGPATVRHCGTGAARPRLESSPSDSDADATGGCGMGMSPMSDDAEKGETEKENGPSFYGLKGVLKKFLGQNLE